MTPLQKQLERLLANFARHYGTSFKLTQGVCALQDSNGLEAAVLELPEGSDALLIHCQILPMQEYAESVNAWRWLMMLNFEMNAMRGCWLALDEDEELRLCYQHAMTTLNQQTFEQLLMAFMQQVNELRELINEMLPTLE